MEWRDIEKDPPPKDGTEILVYTKTNSVAVVRYEHLVEYINGRLTRERSGWQYREDFTHWMLLPTPPKAD